MQKSRPVTGGLRGNRHAHRPWAMRRALCLLAVPMLLTPIGLSASLAQDRRPAPSRGSLTPQRPAAAGQIDLILTGGRIIDGTGKPARMVEIGVNGARITYIGVRPRGVTAKRVIDARGLTVTPGFIDPHTHSGPDALSRDPSKRQLANHLMQGVTSIAVGNDGGGDTDIAALFHRLSTAPTGPNIASYVGFGDLRRAVVGNRDVAPTPAQLGQMQRLTARAMCDGALGLSTGLYYAPQSYAKTREVITLAQIAARYGGIYDTHLRDEGSASIGLIAAIDEAVKIARTARIRLHIAHIKALGADVQGMAPRVTAHIVRAQRSGVTITADQYPWEASSTALAAAIMPRWAQDGGSGAMVGRLNAPTPQLRSAMAEQLRVRGGPDAILMVSGTWKGQKLSALAADWRVPPLDAVARILIAEPGVSIASFNMTAPDIMHFARQPWVVTSSDATHGHPRRTGSFARGWRMFVREQGVMSAERFVQRSSAQTAKILGLVQRGVLAPGNFADIALFDARKFAEQGTYATPDRLATGMHYVLVNGVIAVDQGRLTAQFSGRPLPKPRQPHWSCPA